MVHRRRAGTRSRAAAQASGIHPYLHRIGRSNRPIANLLKLRSGGARLHASRRESGSEAQQHRDDERDARCGAQLEDVAHELFVGDGRAQLVGFVGDLHPLS